ncbi:MAG: cytoskeletal protein CcmA (bactofilin family) [Lentisphaeria bacterium]|jgi:cytoskeletal protein CcmA (bactofilin family)
MKYTKLGLSFAIAIAMSGAQAADLLSGTLNDQAVFSHTYTTTGASLGNQTVWGNVLANQDVTLGAGAKVSGNTQSRDLTTGDGALVSGNTTTVGDTSIGANATVSGDLKSVDLTVGANGTITGNAVNVADSTLGASAMVGGNLQSGAAVTIGATAVVVGTVQHGTALVASASATTGATSVNSTPPSATVIADEHLGVTAAQNALNAMAGSVLATGNIATSQTFTPGVYSVTGSLTTTAGITLTLDAQNQPNAAFIFNISNYLSFGAGTLIDVINGDDDTSVVWNTPGGYTSIGANAQIVGTILANTYVSTGEYSTVTGSGTSCGGVFSATSYVTVGANAIVGGQDCEGAINICLDDYGVIEACENICLDDYGVIEACEVEDTGDIPDVTMARPSYSCIEYNNNKPVNILIQGVKKADTITIDNVTQDEPTLLMSIDHDRNPDAFISNNELRVKVRKQRDPDGDGRVYRIDFTASNNNGEAYGFVEVKFPVVLDENCASVIDNGQHYDSID